ncbi:ANTAR domain-containing protein [Pseudonocardia ammonioxydans]|uniref:ANTAR domain-containing protein n=1 Tax=Pseudonocardia ammonioxydans TaxID=260086 RepID=A0A1I4XNG6_PSUAM|nr:ANTAR domain-containing protein [Pseudonocardia ammonioxydans]SFN27365.1 ANTAR domain-containing protein [Pseudonocardia ammonioxydans]
MVSPHDRLVAGLRTAAHDFMADRPADGSHQGLRQVLTAAVETVPGVDVGGISITRRNSITSRAITSDDVRTLNDLQARLHEGPCFSAVEEPPADGVLVAQDLARPPDTGRWPQFTARAVELGYRSLLSTELSLGRGRRVGMTLYSHTPAVFDDTARTLAGISAVQAALVLYGTDRAAHLQHAVDSRDLIGQAKGILMERFGVDADAGFRMLVRASQDTNMKLVDVARVVAEDRGLHHDGQGDTPGGAVAADT